jgi:tetratricopeptide (TPR) repeat protein
VPYLPFILLFAIALVVRSVYEGGGIIPFFRRDIATQIFTSMPVLTGYLKLLFLPTGLNIAHDVEIYNTPFAFSVLISAVILFFYFINTIYLSRRKEAEWRLLSFFMIWYFVTLLIVIIMPLNRIMQENRCYISGAVFAFFLGVAIGESVYSRHGYKFAYGILAVLIVIYGAGTAYRNTVWKNKVTLWTDAMAKSPYEPLVYNNLSVAYKDIGEYEKAKEVLYRGIRLSPNEWLYHYNLAILFKISGELDYAMLEFDRALMLNPEALLAYVGKGSIYLQKEEIGKGIDIFQEVIHRNPEYALAHYYMAKAFHKLGRPEDAERELELALHYAKKTYNWQLVKRIAKYKNEGFIERVIASEDLIVNQ